MCFIKLCLRIRITDLWCLMLPLYQLSHNQICPYLFNYKLPENLRVCRRLQTAHTWRKVSDSNRALSGRASTSRWPLRRRGPSRCSCCSTGRATSRRRCTRSARSTGTIATIFRRALVQERSSTPRGRGNGFRKRGRREQTLTRRRRSGQMRSTGWRQCAGAGTWPFYKYFHRISLYFQTMFP